MKNKFLIQKREFSRKHVQFELYRHQVTDDKIEIYLKPSLDCPPLAIFLNPFMVCNITNKKILKLNQPDHTKIG